MKRDTRPCRTVRSALCALLLIVGSGSNAAEPLFDGDFESGFLQGWRSSGKNGGIGTLAPAGTCFSNNDTTGLRLHGNYAGLIRSDGQGRPQAEGRLTSLIFAAGDGIAFSALTETSDARPADNPVSFEVRLLDTFGQPLLTQGIRTSRVQLSVGCPSTMRNATFSRHFIDTRPFRGQNIKLQFAQHTRISGHGYFTLIDDIVIFGGGETPIFEGKLTAVAGTSTSETGALQLDGSLSLGSSGQVLSFEWSIDGEAVARTGEKVDISDLEPGTYTVTLFVSDGTQAESDTMLLGIAGGTNGSGPGTTLTLTKSASPTTYDAVGDIIEYSYEVTNTGSETISGPIAVDDDNVDAGGVSCPDGDLAAGDSLTCTAARTVTAADIDSGSIVNRAAASGVDANGEAVSSSEVTVTVTATQN